jgi:stage V sporulation protein S
MAEVANLNVSIPQSSTRAAIIKVASTSRATSVAGAIAAVMRERSETEVQAIGAGAVNQAVKALAIARQYLVDDQINIVCTPQFIDLEIQGNERTAVRFTVERRWYPKPVCRASNDETNAVSSFFIYRG